MRFDRCILLREILGEILSVIAVELHVGTFEDGLKSSRAEIDQHFVSSNETTIIVIGTSSRLLACRDDLVGRKMSLARQRQIISFVVFKK